MAAAVRLPLQGPLTGVRDSRQPTLVPNFNGAVASGQEHRVPATTDRRRGTPGW